MYAIAISNSNSYTDSIVPFFIEGDIDWTDLLYAFLNESLELK